MGRRNRYFSDIGKTYNSLTVEAVSENRTDHGEVLLKCVCECGKRIEVTAHRVVTGKKKSCGCKTKEDLRKSLLSVLAGQRFGRLTAEYEIVTPEGGQSRWLCKCDCGSSVIVKGSSLKRGATKSCGCYRNDRVRETCTRDLTGFRAGKLTVIRKAIGHSTRDGSHWECICDCGTQLIVRGSSLTSSNTTSCGCTNSTAEYLIASLLKEHAVDYIKEKTFPDLRCKNPLRFDFFLPKHNVVIEYNGPQHFGAVTFFGGEESFVQQRKRDKMKREYCLSHGIRCIDIQYTVKTKDGIENILKAEHIL